MVITSVFHWPTLCVPYYFEQLKAETLKLYKIGKYILKIEAAFSY